MKAIEKDPTVPIYFSNAATCKSRLGRHEEALELINKAITLDPLFFKAYYRRGVCLMELKRFQEASEDFITVSREFPSDTEAQRHLKACDRELDKKVSFEDAMKAGFSSAIKVARFELNQSSINGLSVDASYSGPEITFETKIDVEWVKNTLIPYFEADKKLNIKHAYTVSQSAVQRSKALILLPLASVQG